MMVVFKSKQACTQVKAGVQVGKLEQHVAAQRTQITELEACTAEGTASHEAEVHKLQASVKSLGHELARQRLVNRQLKGEHIEQCANLAAQQHEAQRIFDTGSLVSLLGAHMAELIV